MKTPKPTTHVRLVLRHLAFALAVGAGLGAGSAPAQDISYIPNSTLLKDWTSIPGGNAWADWAKVRTTSLDPVTGDITLGVVGGQEGWIEIDPPAGMSYVNSGLEMTFVGPSVLNSTNMYLMMVSWTTPREGFVVTTSSTGTVGETRQMFRDGANAVGLWSVQPANVVGAHTMALVRLANGDVNTYMDGILVGTKTGTPTPAAALGKIGVGNQYTGGQYLPRGFVVSQVRAFTVSPVVGAVNADKSTLAALPPQVWADGAATATIKVTLRDENGYPVPGKEVTLASTRPADDTVSAASGPSDASGVVSFTVSSLVVGESVFTATDTTDSGLAITATATVTFKTKPPAVTEYIAGSTVIQDWDFTNSQNPGNWTRQRTTYLTPAGLQLGLTPPQPPPAVDHGAWVGLMRIAVPAGLSYFDSGVEFTYYGPAGPPPTSGFEFLSLWRSSTRTGFTILASSLTGTPRTKQEDATGTTVDWTTTPTGEGLAGLHTMALVRYSNGTVESWLDGVLMGTRSSFDPVNLPEFISIGWNVNGNMYMPFNTIVSQVRAFTVTPEVAAVDPALSTVVASPAAAWADGLAFSTVTVTLKDTNGLLVPNKEVSLAISGPGAPVMTPATPVMTGPNGKATFVVTSNTPGDYEITATETTDDPDVVLSPSTLSFVTPGTLAMHLNFDNALRTGLEGPAGGLDKSWNQPLALAASNLLDADGVATSVSMTNSCDGIDAWGATLPLLYSAARSFGWDVPRTMEISGLDPAKKYDLYIASYYKNEAGSTGIFTTTNVTSNGQTQNNDNGGANANSATWVQGQNYVLFKDVVPNELNKIIIGAAGVDGKRAMWSGFQLMESTGVPTDSFASWIGALDWTGFTDPDLTATGDPDGDGFENSVEYVLGTQPNAASVAGAGVSTADGNFVFSFQRAVASKTADVAVAIEVGTDLMSWPNVYLVGPDTESSTPGVTVGAAVNGFETVTLSLLQGADAMKFGRLRVTVTGP